MSCTVKVKTLFDKIKKINNKYVSKHIVLEVQNSVITDPVEKANVFANQFSKL